MSTQLRVDALCLACGTVRTVAARYIGRGERRLKCQHCRASTMHGSATGLPDLREFDNSRVAVAAADDLAVAEANIADFRAWWVQVHREKWVQGGHVGLVHYPDIDEYAVHLGKGLTPAGTVKALEWAWRNLLPSHDRNRRSWPSAEVFIERATGRPWRGIYLACGRCGRGGECQWFGHAGARQQGGAR